MEIYCQLARKYLKGLVGKNGTYNCIGCEEIKSGLAFFDPRTRRVDVCWPKNGQENVTTLPEARGLIKNTKSTP
jgi:hypothetical protein